MKIIDVEQGSDEWRLARLGKVGASMVSDATARIKTGWGASRKNLLAQLVAERLTGNLTTSYTNAAMDWGIATEPEARDAYAFVHGVTVTTVGLVLHPTIDMACASPDGLAGEAGLVEIKCPNTATHIATLRGGEIDGGYFKQMQWQMACTGREWCDFASFDPRMPAEMMLHVRRVHRDPVMIAELETQIREFLKEVDDTVAELVAMYRQPMAAE